MEEWLTTHDAARLFGYHVERVRELIRESKIVARKFGPVWQVNRESLSEYVSRVREVGKKRGRKPCKKAE